MAAFEEKLGRRPGDDSPIHLRALADSGIGQGRARCLPAVSSQSLFLKAASPASDTSTHFGSGEASAS